MPAGYTCLRQLGGGAIELALEVEASASSPKTRIKGMTAQSISMAVKGREGPEANSALCSFLRSVLGGPTVTCEVTRGFKAPVKAVRVSGVEGLDLAYHRLLMAQKFIK